MKRLLLLRHAKSDWNAPFETDHDRPLAPRGRRAAGQVGRFLNAVERIPDRAITSSAVRARTTLDLAAKEGSWHLPASAIEETKALYLATATRLIDVVRQQDNAVQILMLVGHEPSWSDLLSRLVGGGYHRFPTATIASIRFDVDFWIAVAPGAGMLEWLAPAKLLGKIEI